MTGAHNTGFGFGPWTHRPVTAHTLVSIRGVGVPNPDVRRQLGFGDVLSTSLGGRESRTHDLLSPILRPLPEYNCQGPTHRHGGGPRTAASSYTKRSPPRLESVPRGAAEAPEARAASPRPSIPRVPTWTPGKMLSRFCFFITFPSQSRPAPSPVTAGFLSLLLSFAPAKEARRAAGGWGAPRQAAAAGRGRGRTMANCGQQPTESNVGRRPSAAAQAAEMQAEPGGGWGGGIGA